MVCSLHVSRKSKVIEYSAGWLLYRAMNVPHWFVEVLTGLVWTVKSKHQWALTQDCQSNTQIADLHWWAVVWASAPPPLPCTSSRFCDRTPVYSQHTHSSQQPWAVPWGLPVGAARPVGIRTWDCVVGVAKNKVPSTTLQMCWVWGIACTHVHMHMHTCTHVHMVTLYKYSELSSMLQHKVKQLQRPICNGWKVSGTHLGLLHLQPQHLECADKFRMIHHFTSLFQGNSAGDVPIS